MARHVQAPLHGGRYTWPGMRVTVQLLLTFAICKRICTRVHTISIL